MTCAVNKGDVESKVASEISHTYGKLVSEQSFGLNMHSNEISLSSKLICQSNSPGVPTTAVGVGISPSSLLPKFGAECTFPKIEGRIDGCFFVALDVKIAVETTPKLPKLQLVPVDPQRSPVLVDWSEMKITNKKLVVAGAVIIAATIVEDFLTLGAGAADDPASFAAAAGALIARGLSVGRAIVPVTAARSYMVGTALLVAPQYNVLGTIAAVCRVLSNIAVTIALFIRSALV